MHRAALGATAAAIKIERIDHADDLPQLGPRRERLRTARQQAEMPPEPRRVRRPADLDQHPLETSVLRPFAQPRGQPFDLRRFVARRNFQHRVMLTPHRAAKSAQRLRIEVQRAGDSPPARRDFRPDAR